MIVSTIYKDANELETIKKESTSRDKEERE